MSTESVIALAFCRPGFEADCASELADISAAKNCYGFAKQKTGQGFVEFHFYASHDAVTFVQQTPVHALIFTRQLVWVIGHIGALPKHDRVGSFIDTFKDVHENTQAILGRAPKIGSVSVDYVDTEEGKSVAKFAKKVVVPLRQAMRQQALILNKENNRQDRLHVILNEFDSAWLGMSFASTRSPHANGIHRLKFPAEAPSRSTLKLEEAILDLVSESQRKSVFREGARAVDLGACPGGWTYQLVSRGMYVEAVDNGKMAESLMKTGLVSYAAADGFKYKPEFNSVELIVCDMIEKPDRVAALMTKWLNNGWANAAIFNLKLPMKQRYDVVKQLLFEMQENLKQGQTRRFDFQCKHLYHDRDEVTVAVLPH